MKKKESVHLIDRFESFNRNISQAYKYMLKIKSYYMKDLGLKAAHVMCLLHIGKAEDGVTAGELSALCMEDKAAISKSLTELKNHGLIWADDENGSKTYRVKYHVTQLGADVYKTISAHIVEAVTACSSSMSLEEGRVFFSTLGDVVENLKGYYESLEKSNQAD